MGWERRHQREHGQPNCSGLRDQLSAAALAGRLGRARPSGSVPARVCGGSGFGKAGLRATDQQRGPSAVCGEFAFENMALWVLASDSFAPEIGAGVPQRITVALVERDELSRSQYFMAF